MDPICKKKIIFLQKYVPCLANLIELLSNDSEKGGTLAQMQLLYDLLNNPDNSVTIETLEKCEEVLSRAFGNEEEKHNEAASKEGPDSNLIEKKPNLTNRNAQNEMNERNENNCSEEKNAEQIHHPEDQLAEKIPKTQVANKSTATTTCQNGNEVIIKKEKDISDAAEMNGNDFDCHLQMQLQEQIPTDVRGTEIEMENQKCITNEPIPEGQSLVIASASTIYEDTKQFLKKDVHVELNEDENLILSDNGQTSELSTKQIGQVNLSKNDEIINYEDKDENLLLPTDDAEMNVTNVIRQNKAGKLPFKILSAESLIIQSVQSLSEKENLNLFKSIEAVKDQTFDFIQDTAKEMEKTKDDLDPLDTLNNPPANLLKTPSPPLNENGSANLNYTNNISANTDEGDDDDVLLIETRASPICLDSDPEEEELIKQNRSLARFTSKTIVVKQKPNARRSTSIVMDTIRDIIKHQNVSIKKISSHQKSKKHFYPDYLRKRDPKSLMETIDLIDSDSEDERLKRSKKHNTNDDEVIIISSTKPLRKLNSAKKQFTSQLSKRSSTHVSTQILNKSHRKTPTAQSNFLNAVNLQPAPKSNSIQPASFSAHLYNKKLIIPNAFYGNPSHNRNLLPGSVKAASQDESSSNDSLSRNSSHSTTVSIRQVQDRMLKEWLENFLKHFTSPLQIASHACFVLLQRVLKYRFFQRLKETRVNLNTLVGKPLPESLDMQLLLDLRNVFIENDKLTEDGRRFCRFATNDAFGKPVALTTDSRTGKVTSRTRVGSKTGTSAMLNRTKPPIPERTTSATQMSSISSTNSGENLTKAAPSNFNTPVPIVAKRNRKSRKLSDGVVIADVDDDDNDYTPHKGDVVLQEEVVTERKKSLRTNRTKRKEAGFTYSEDHDDEEFEALAKKIEDKKREELRLAEEKELEKEREKERKAKKTVAKKTTSKRQGAGLVPQMGTDTPREPNRKKLRLADAEILGNADDDLLTPTWVEADGDDNEADSLLDFADGPQTIEMRLSDNENNPVENATVADVVQDSEDSNSDHSLFDVGTNKSLKNTNRNLHTQGNSIDYCVHCQRRVPRTVHHYVNEHRSSEVFSSRLRSKDIRRLLTTSNVGFVHLYKGNQQQYAAHCIFCDKDVKFLLPYWFEHFTMHTGEYSFKCSGCHIRKPTRSLLTNHLQSGTGCPKKGSTIKLYNFDTKSNQIEAHICAICYYVQMHRKNMLRHLRTQHNLEAVSENHIIKVVLLQISGPYLDHQTITKNNESQLSLLQISSTEENGIDSSLLDENSLMMQNDFTDNDDLSFMICGMLDVQTNLSTLGESFGNNKTTANTINNK